MPSQLWKGARSLLTFAAFAAFGAAMAAGGGSGGAESLKLDQPVAGSRLPAAVNSPVGEYVVTLTSPALAKAVKNAGKLSKDEQKAYLKKLKEEQDQASAQVAAIGGKELARVSKALNGLAVAITARQAKEIEQLPGVLTVRPLNTYQLDLSETVPYIGAAAVQAGGNTGAGIRVAVLDSGIDYTHVAFGGPGTAAFYSQCYGSGRSDLPPSPPCDAYFGASAPKVKGGYDFVGEAWPSGPLAPDANPLDFEGHGTHVADIIGGSTAGRPGVAPGAHLYAVKVCSAVATSCSGVALLQGVDFALDPNQNGFVDDRVDVINLSLGSSYGQDEDDLTQALNNASGLGVVVVASAGNSADRPYIVGSPSSGRSVISVAQTQVPSASAIPLVVNSPASIAGVYTNTATVDWAPIGAGVTGNVVFVGRGCVGDPYLANPAGKVVLIDRGTCAISQKVDRAANAGAIGVLLGLTASGDAITFSLGDGSTFVPTLVITQSVSNLVKSRLAAGDTVNVTVSPAAAVSLVGSMVGSSSRGPTFSRNSIKPDIGAPGASVSAVAGTGSGTTAFGGTSGAAPMVSGAAALLLKARPGITPAEVKSILMNTGNTNVFVNPATQPGILAPITRIGGGEIRIDKAIASRTAAWDKDDETGSLSFGYSSLSKKDKVKRKVVVTNYGTSERTYTITPAFRYADDAASGAVKIKAPSSIKVKAGKSSDFDVELEIDAGKLPIWTLNGGSRGGDGFRLQGVEFDGYIGIDGGPDNTVHVAWQVMPRRAAEASADPKKVNLTKDGTGSVKLKNKSGVLGGDFEVFALTGESDEIKKKLLPQPGDNFAVVDLKAVGVRGSSSIGIVQFAIDTFRARAHPNYPAEFDVYIDVNRDGIPDFIVFNAENGSFASTGQNLTYVYSFATGSATAYFFTDADLNSGNAVLTAPLSVMGLTPGTTFDFSVYAFDNYFTGNLTDAIEGMTFTVDTPRFVPSADFGTVPMDGELSLGIASVPGGGLKSPSQTGLLLLYRNAEGDSRKDVGKEEGQALIVKP